jgi:Calx-beta domain/Periplasmic copper-binding protein (NosD)
MRVVGRKLSSLTVVVALFGIGATFVAAAPAGAVGPTTVVVSYGDIAPNGPWALEPTSNTGNYAFVNGPAPTPGGTGSLAMTIASGQHEWLNNYEYGACATGPACNNTAAKTPIANFDALSYSTYRASGSVTPTFNMEVHITGTSGYTTLVFVPDANAVVNSNWQTWDTMNPADGVWYSTHNVGSGVFNCSPFSCSASWSAITTSYPNAKVAFGLGPNVGTGGTFVGNVDGFTVGVSGTTKVYDFERVECTSTCSVDVNGNDNNTGLPGDPLKTIQAGVNKVQAGGTVLVSAGTFAENVTVAQSVDIQGSGTSTVVVPAVSNPDCGGAGGGSLCSGASSVFLVQHDGVTIDHLKVDGDNPSLSGVAVGGADVDARNGIITNHNAGTFNSLSVHDVTVKNVFLRGIYASSGGSFNLSNNTVDNVQGDPASIGIFDYLGGGTIANNHVSNANDAISANHSTGTQFTGNTVTASGSGVHTDNNGDSGGSADVISGNTVSACTTGGYGVFAFVPYLAPTISNNTVSGCDVGLAAFASCDLGGTNSCPSAVIPTVTFSGNHVTGTSGGQGLLASTTSFGFGDGEVHVQADHNIVSGAADGVYVQETGTAHAAVALSRNALAGNTAHGLNNAGTSNVNAKCNWWGQSSGPAVGEVSGNVTTDPYLITSNLAGNCIPILRIGTAKVPVVEGNSGTTPANLTVSLDRKSSQAVTVQWHTLNGTAVAGDYTGAFGTLTFSPGQTTKTITVNVKGDTVLEDYEYFSVKLVSPTNALLANSQEQIEIRNDEKPTMTVNNVSAVEGSLATFTVTLAQRYYQPITVAVSSADGTAHAPGDYNAVPAGKTITIPAGATSRTVSVGVKVDGLTEPAETFMLTFSSSSTNNSPRTATATITANGT